MDPRLKAAMALQKAGKLAEAEEIYADIVAKMPGAADALHLLGVVKHQQGDSRTACDLLKKAVAVNPRFAKAHNNFGIALRAQGKLEEAMAAYRKAIALEPGLAEAHYNLGNALKVRGELRQAVAAFRKALKIKPDYTSAGHNLGNTLKDLGKLDQAAAEYRRVLALDPGHGAAQAMLVYMLEHVCDWEKLGVESAKLEGLTDAALAGGGKPGETPFTNIIRCDDAARNLAVAKAWSTDKANQMSDLADQARFTFDRAPRDRIRLAYLSADFRGHPIAHLMASLFGLHDREAFEVFAYSYGHDDGSDYRKRIVEGVDSFTDIRDLTALDAARRIHADGIDILVDLMGYTTNTRIEICVLRPAPVQATYLGFPGTTGADFIDYALTDRIITPEDQAPYYLEKFAYLPHSYLVSDHAQAISDKLFTRAEFGLPGDDGFVFCSFNQAYKIEPVMWDAWMRILQSVPESVLWLSCPNRTAQKNLKQAAEARGVEAKRIVFANKLATKPEHLARMKLADLFLDTRIYNAHTTASDALWAGVPVVTLQGRHFASRVASSLLTAIGLNELITHDLDGYEDLAIGLARAPDELARISGKLAENRLKEPLFDTPRFARNLERAYRRMWEIYLAGGKPRRIEVIDRGA